eukprot:comp23344_c0_seq1/m.38512 comp23344_c0_seq1/g.38512  ORF comp23344_c0_seq1/g.38512 comp23344_c0_seq1/m.38512 type:complete len:193 (-) comp23344_c0_seq1:461-1039(-)
MVVGKPLPSIHGLEFIKGKPVDVNDRKRVYVIECWATWCPPCRQSIPHLTDLQRKYGPRGVTIIGVTSEQKGPVVPFVEKMGSGMDYTVALDSEDSVQELQFQAGAKGIPHSFVINTQGIIVFSGHPMEPAFEQKLEEAANQWKPEPITLTREQLMGLSVKELKGILAERRVSAAGCVEKGDMVQRILDMCT